MRKKPRTIFSVLLNILNNLDVNNEYSINEISDKAGLHWKTTEEYLEILFNIIRFIPKTKLNEENGKIVIEKHSNYYEELTLSQKILVNLYEHKAFDEKSAVPIEYFNSTVDLEIYVEDLILKEQIAKIDEDDYYFILQEGKKIAFSIFSQITAEIFSIDAETKLKDQEIGNLGSEFNEINRKYDELIVNYRIIQKQNEAIINQNKRMFSLINMFSNLDEFLDIENSNRKRRLKSSIVESMVSQNEESSTISSYIYETGFFERNIKNIPEIRKKKRNK